MPTDKLALKELRYSLDKLVEAFNRYAYLMNRVVDYYADGYLLATNEKHVVDTYLADIRYWLSILDSPAVQPHKEDVPTLPTLNDSMPMSVPRYRDKDGHPTCASNFETGQVCMFYATQRFGCHETCWFAGKDSRYWGPMDRRDDGNGSLIPLSACPVWHSLG